MVQGVGLRSVWFEGGREEERREVGVGCVVVWFGLYHHHF